MPFTVINVNPYYRYYWHVNEISIKQIWWGIEIKSKIKVKYFTFQLVNNHQALRFGIGCGVSTYVHWCDHRKTNHLQQRFFYQIIMTQVNWKRWFYQIANYMNQVIYNHTSGDTRQCSRKSFEYSSAQPSFLERLLNKIKTYKYGLIITMSVL